MKELLIKAMTKEMLLKENFREMLKENRGSSVLTDHGLFVIVGVVLISAVLVFATAFTNNDFLPAIKTKIMSLLS